MSDTKNTPELQRVSFEQLMNGRYFVIPEYQRHYAWTKKECLELFEDCILTARHPGRLRFLSTITVIDPAGESNYDTLIAPDSLKLKPLLVVDGQQRLTSILILISCLCRILRSDKNDAAVRIAYEKFVLTPLSDGSVKLRVTPQPIPHLPELMLETLTSIVALDNTNGAARYETHIPAQTRLKEAREVFEDGLKRLNYQQVSLKHLLDCITTRLIFILNKLSDIGQAGEVFEGLNNRGLGLSVLENLKAYSIYAVQTFRQHESLPNGVPGTATKLIDDFNNSIGEIYYYLDRVRLTDDSARDLLSAFWPQVVREVQNACVLRDPAKGVPEILNRDQPVEEIRSSLHIQQATTPGLEARLLNTLDFMVCKRLVQSSKYFADARRPRSNLSFQGIELIDSDKQELKDLHQRLVEMQSSTPFLTILLAYRMTRPKDAPGYLYLLRLIERVAFWVYLLAGRRKGSGQNVLSRMALSIVEENWDLSRICLGLRSFALKGGRSAKPDLENADFPDLKQRLNEVIQGQRHDVSAAISFEWLFSRTVMRNRAQVKAVELPSFGRFLRRITNDDFVYLVWRRNEAAGYSLSRADMCHSGNIIVTAKMPEIDDDEFNAFNKLSYPEKRNYLRNLGYNAPLPLNTITTDWAKRQQNQIANFALQRWSIPDDGMIKVPTWQSAMPEPDEDYAADDRN